MGVISIGLLSDTRRVLFLATTCFFVAIGNACLPAYADDGTLYVAPGPSNLISSETIRRNQYQPEGSARKLGDIIGSSLKSPTSHVTDVVVTTKCGHYQSATITFSDGLIKTLNLSNAPASQQDVDKAKAAIPSRLSICPGAITDES
jgi:hypothetical protein